MLKKYLFKRKLKQTSNRRLQEPWVNNSLLQCDNLIHFSSKYFDSKIIQINELGSRKIDIREINGITNTNTDIDENELFNLEQLTADKKRLSCSTEADFVSNTKWIDDRFEQWRCYRQDWDKKLPIYTRRFSSYCSNI